MCDFRAVVDAGFSLGNATNPGYFDLLMLIFIPMFLRNVQTPNFVDLDLCIFFLFPKVWLFECLFVFFRAVWSYTDFYRPHATVLWKFLSVAGWLLEFVCGWVFSVFELVFFGCALAVDPSLRLDFYFLEICGPEVRAFQGGETSETTVSCSAKNPGDFRVRKAILRAVVKTPRRLVRGPLVGAASYFWRGSATFLVG